MPNFFQWNGSTDNGAAYITSVRGSITTIITANITATLTTDTTFTSSVTALLEYNSILLQSTLGTGGGTATVIAGTLTSGGTMVPIIDKDTSAQMTTGLLTSSRIQRFTGLPDYIGFTTTLSAGITAGSSVTIKIQPLNL